MLEFHERMENYRHILVSPMIGRDVTLLCEMPGNVGDHLIQRGSEKLLTSMEISYTPTPVSKISESGGDLLVIPGSGAFTARWHEWLPELVINASKDYESIVVLPSSYDPHVEVVAEVLRLSNVFLFAREVRSYNMGKSMAKIELGFDPALFSLPKMATATKGVEDLNFADSLVALRTDVGSLTREKSLLINSEINNDISLSCKNLEDFLECIKSKNTIITDRLHVAVAAFLLGKSLICIDTYDDKISTYFNFVLRDSQSDVLSYRDYDWLVETGIVRRMEK